MAVNRGAETGFLDSVLRQGVETVCLTMELSYGP